MRFFFAQMTSRSSRLYSDTVFPLKTMHLDTTVTIIDVAIIIEFHQGTQSQGPRFDSKLGSSQRTHIR